MDEMRVRLSVVYELLEGISDDLKVQDKTIDIIEDRIAGDIMGVLLALCAPISDIGFFVESHRVAN